MPRTARSRVRFVETTHTVIAARTFRDYKRRGPARAGLRDNRPDLRLTRRVERAARGRRGLVALAPHPG